MKEWICLIWTTIATEYELVTLRSVLESSWCGKTDLVLLVYFISVSIVKKDGDDIIKTC